MPNTQQPIFCLLLCLFSSNTFAQSATTEEVRDLLDLDFSALAELEVVVTGECRAF